MEKSNLLRKEAAVFLTESGFPITAFSLQKLASTGGGPIYQIWGNKAVYTPPNLLAWARAKISAPRRSTSEAHEAERLEAVEDDAAKKHRAMLEKAERLEGAAK